MAKKVGLPKALARVLSGLMLGLMLTAIPHPALARPGRSIDRLGGTDRYGTMSLIASESFDSCPWAIVATGTNFPDALAASALAGARNCPIVLTTPNSLCDDARDELARLGASHVHIVGGAMAVSENVERQIRAMGIDVDRVAGDDRTATSIALMQAAREAGSSSDTVVIATGWGFADSLSFGPWAFKTATPIILATNGTLSPAAVKAIRSDAGIDRVLIAGGTAVVSDEVMSQLGNGYEYQRLSGPDRYHTSMAIANWECSNGLSWRTPALATGRIFPDALAGTALMGSKGSPLLLVADSSLDALGLLVVHKQEVSSAYILGGTAAVGKKPADCTAWILNAIP